MAEHFFGLTDVGKMRDNNEDNFIAEKIRNKDFITACVIDGVGGYEGGEVAAELARNAVLQTLNKSETIDTTVLKKALQAANKKIFSEKQQNEKYDQMACVLTLAAVNIQQNKFYYAHVGDTRLYLFRDASLVKISHDHSFVGFLEDNGRLTEEAAMKHPKRNEITKAIGFDEEQFLKDDYVETGESPFLPGDIILLCSDGLSDMIDQKKMIGILSANRSIKQKAKALIEAANDAGGKDNITVVLVENYKSRQQHEATKPAPTKITESEKPVEKKEEPPKEKALANLVLTQHKKNSGITTFLLVLCLLLLVVISAFVYKDYLQKKPTVTALPTTVAIQKSEGEILLQDSLTNSKAQVLSFKNFANDSIIRVTGSLFIHTDSLHLKNIHLVADSSFNGAAFIMQNNCKYVLLDSVVFENFHTGILTSNASLHLQNVRFINCTTPVMRAYSLPENTVVNAKLTDTLSYKKDSLENKHK